jgi:hypothetical protein
VAKCGAQLLAELHTTVWRCGAAQLVRAHVASSLLGTTEIDVVQEAKRHDGF